MRGMCNTTLHINALKRADIIVYVANIRPGKAVNLITALFTLG